MMSTLSFSQKIGLNPKKNLSQYVLRNWNTEHGLASETVNSILQSDDGYMWIGTYAGLHRFDGKDFTSFNSDNSELPASNVFGIENGKNGELWIGTLHGIAIYENGRFYIPEALRQVQSDGIEHMLLTSNGDLWFSTKSNLLFHYSDELLTDKTAEFNVSTSTVLSIEEGSQGAIYFGTDDSRLIILENEELNTVALDTEINGVNTLFHHSDVLYLGTGAGLYIWDGSLNPTRLKNTTIKSLLVDTNETIWAGTMKGIFRIKRDGEMDVLSEKNGLPNNIIEDLSFDKTGNLWVGTHRKGIVFLSDGPITSFTKNDGLGSNIASSVIETEEGSYILGNENGRLDLLQNGAFERFRPNLPIPEQRLKNLYLDSKNRIWVSTYGGLVVIDGPKARYFNIANGFPDNFTRVAYELADGSVLLGTKNAGIAVFKSLNEWSWITVDDGLTTNYILSIEQIDNGDVLVGTISGLNIIREGKVVRTITTKDGLPSNFMFTTYTSGDYTWIASNDGLSCYTQDTVFTFDTSNGMPTNNIFDILEDDNGYFWMPSENSILNVKVSELIAVIKNKTQKFTVRQFDRSHGMKNSHCIGAVHSFKDSKGMLWIPTYGGIARVNPQESINETIEPTLVIEDIYSGDKNFQELGELSIPASENRISIKYTGISYTQTDLIELRYRLIPFEEKWVNSSSDRIAEYTNLAPGGYTFQLQAGIGGAFFDTTATQKIYIEAAWWQTLWAKVLAVVTLVFLALLFYWVRTKTLTSINRRLELTVVDRTQKLEQQKNALNETIQQLKSAQEQMVQSDKMASLGVLAAGVAHEINNPLNFIQGGVDGLEQTLKSNKNLKKEDYSNLIVAIKEGVNRAATIVSSLNEFSHSTEEKKGVFSVHHIINNCLTMVQHRVKEGIDLQINFFEKDLKIMANSGKIHQAFLNIITNALQAIKADGWVKITTHLESKSIKIVFEDSGEGIKPENLKRITEPFFSTKDPGKGTGLGLSITYSIITEHGGTLNFTSVWKKGTTATVTLPAHKG